MINYVYVSSRETKFVIIIFWYNIRHNYLWIKLSLQT